MDSVRTRCIIDSLDIIVDLSVIDEGRKTLWTAALTYRIYGAPLAARRLY